MQVTCPQCGKDDQLKKISTWVEEDSSDNIARQFLPRTQPEAPSPLPGINTGLGCLGIIFFGAVFFVSVQAGSTIAIIIFGVFFAIFAVAFGAAYLRGRRARQEYMQFILDWQVEMEKWDRLYYCKRDDLVFDAQSGQSSPAADWQSLIRENQSHQP